MNNSKITKLTAEDIQNMLAKDKSEPTGVTNQVESSHSESKKQLKTAQKKGGVNVSHVTSDMIQNMKDDEIVEKIMNRILPIMDND